MSKNQLNVVWKKLCYLINNESNPIIYGSERNSPKCWPKLVKRTKVGSRVKLALVQHVTTNRFEKQIEINIEKLYKPLF